MFKVVNVKGNSVRINVANLLSFDVQVIQGNGRKLIRKPNDIYLNNSQMAALVKTVLEAYEFNEEKGFNVDVQTEKAKS